MKLTIKEVVEKTGVTQPEANGFVKTLVALGRATKVGTVPQASGKGRAAIVYEINEAEVTKVSAEVAE